MTTATDQVEARPVEPGAGAIQKIADLPREMAILRIDNENMMAMMAARPRNYAVVLQDIKDQLAAFPTFARAAMYAKPVGKDPKTREMKYARGLSIRAAEAIAAAYGYNRVRSSIVPVDADTVRVTATFTDFQQGRIWERERLVSRHYKGRDGNMRRHTEDRFLGVVCEAEGSKAIRECILRSVPPGLRSELEACVDEQVDGLLDDATVTKIVAQFSGKGVSLAQLEGHIGKPSAAFTKEDRATLLGVWNMIDQGESTVAEVFGATASGGTPTDEGKTQTAALGDKLAVSQKAVTATQGKTPPEAQEQTDALKTVTNLRARAMEAFTRIPEADRKDVLKSLDLINETVVNNIGDPDMLDSILNAFISAGKSDG